MTTQNDEPPEQQSQLPKTLTLETPNPQNQQQGRQQQQLEQDDLEMLSPLSQSQSQSIPNRPPTTSVYMRRPNKRRKLAPQQKKRVQQEKKSMKRLELLKQELKPIPFTPFKKLDFSPHESLLKRLGLWDFLHLEFDPDIRTDLIAQLIANYCPSARGSYVNGAKIRVNRADLARALNLSVRKDKIASDGSGELPEKESEESIRLVEEIVSNWMLLHDDTWMMPTDVLNWMKLIKEGNFEKMDWASLIWFMMEKELTAPQLSHCYYASHMQCLIKNQKEGMLREDVKQEEEEDVHGDVLMLDAVEGSKKAEHSEKAELEESNVELSLGQENVGNLEEVSSLRQGLIVNLKENLSLGQENVGNLEEVSSLGQGNVVNSKEDWGLGQENVVNFKEDVGLVQENVSDLNENASEGQENVVDLQEDVGHGQENVVNLQENVSLGQENVVNLQENVGHGQENVFNLQENASLVQENVVTLQENASLLQDNVVNLQENMSSVQENFVNLQESVGNEEKELAGDDVVINFGGNKNEEKGQWFLHEKIDVPENGHFLRGCTLGDIKAMDCEVEEKKQEVIEEVVEEGDEEGGEEEEEEEEQHEGGFSLSPRGENLEMVTSANLIQGMEAVQVPYTPGIQICDDDLPGEFLASRVDNNTNAIAGGSSSHFGNGNKRQIGQSNELPHQSLNGSNKRMRSASSDFDECLEQMQHWMGKARMLYQAKEQVCEESSVNQQLLYDELQKRENMIEHLHKAKYEEQQKRNLEVYRLERELYLMGNILEGYRKALKETRKAFAEYRARCPQADEPLYKDVAGGRGLVLSSMEWERQRAKQEEEEERIKLEEEREKQELERMKEEEERMKQEEDKRMKQEEEARMTQLLIEKKIKEFEEGWNMKLEAHRDGLHLLSKRVLDVENEVKHLKEFRAKQKVSETSECAPNE